MLRKYLGLIVFALAMTVRLVFSLFPGFFERVYFEACFPVIRKILHPVGRILPFSGYYLIILIALVWLVWRFPRPLKSRLAWVRFSRRLANFLGGFFSIFLLLWGFLYVGPGLAERMELTAKNKSYDVAEIYMATMERAFDLRVGITLPNDSASVENLKFEESDTLIYRAMSTFLLEYGYPVEPRVKVRKVKPDGTLRRLGISGIYNPFTGEANVEATQGSISGSFTIAHEMAHAMGITGEGEANFAAYAALLSSSEPVLQYAAVYTLWRYIASDVRSMLPEEEQVILASNIPDELMIDRMAIWQRSSQHRPYFPELSESVNDQYLKLQGIRAGTEDYNAFVSLFLRYEEKLKVESSEVD